MRFPIIVLFSAMTVWGASKPASTVVETDGARITIGTQKVGRYEAGCSPSFCAIYLRVENKGDSPSNIDLGNYFMQTSDGKALPSMSASEVKEMLIGKSALLTTALVGPGMRKPTQQGFEARISGLLFATGQVPPHSFREGTVHFRGTGDKRTLPTTLHLVGLAPSPVALNWR